MNDREKIVQLALEQSVRDMVHHYEQLENSMEIEFSSGFEDRVHGLINRSR